MYMVTCLCLFATLKTISHIVYMAIFVGFWQQVLYRAWVPPCYDIADACDEGQHDIAAQHTQVAAFERTLQARMKEIQDKTEQSCPNHKHKVEKRALGNCDDGKLVLLVAWDAVTCCCHADGDIASKQYGQRTITYD